MFLPLRLEEEESVADGAGGINFYHDGNSICWRRERETRKAQQEEGSNHGWVDQEERGWKEGGGFGVDYEEGGRKTLKTSITYLAAYEIQKSST